MRLIGIISRRDPPLTILWISFSKIIVSHLSGVCWKHLEFQNADWIPSGLGCLACLPPWRTNRKCTRPLFLASHNLDTFPKHTATTTSFHNAALTLPQEEAGQDSSPQSQVSRRLGPRKCGGWTAEELVGNVSKQQQTRQAGTRQVFRQLVQTSIDN